MIPVDYKVALVFGRDYSSTATNMTSLDLTLSRVDSIRSRFNTNRLTSCSNTLLGIENVDAVNMSIYPSPSNGILYISSSETITGVEVRDLNLKLIYSVQENGKEELIDLSSEPAGMYFISVRTKNSLKVSKIILTK